MSLVCTIGCSISFARLCGLEVSAEDVASATPEWQQVERKGYIANWKGRNRERERESEKKEMTHTHKSFDWEAECVDQGCVWCYQTVSDLVNAK